MKQDLNKLMCLDLYLSGTPAQSEASIENVTKVDSILPLVSWDVFSDSYFKQLIASKKAMDIKKINAYAKRHGWKNDLQTIFDATDFEAIILCDKNQNIVWVNEGFTNMTGYTKKEVLGKTPKLLQGAKTDPKATTEIALNLKKNNPFKTQLLNYRKNKQPYNCEIQIFPLGNVERTHYIALEKEIL